MKYCPTCQTKYDEEIMRFCTKDGTPLIDENQPNFVELPSEGSDAADASIDDSDEETVVRRKNTVIEPINEQPERDSQRLVVPVAAEKTEPVVRTKTTSYTRQSPPPTQKSNTALVVLATMLGTILVLGGAFGAYWLLSGSDDNQNLNANSSINVNQDTNLNTNLAIDNSLFNVNTNANINANTNVNANVKTPTPTPTRTPTPTPSPTPDDDDDNRNANTNTNTNRNTNTSNSATPANTKPTPTPSPRVTPTAPPANLPVNLGNLNSRAVNLPKPPYPSAARALRASGQVVVRVLVDEAGRVISADAVSGHPLLRGAAVQAARQSRFNPHRVSGQAVKSAGTVVYNFVDN